MKIRIKLKLKRSKMRQIKTKVYLILPNKTILKIWNLNKILVKLKLIVQVIKIKQKLIK